MKAVILSCNTGGGHNAAAHALQQAFALRGHQAAVLDYLTLASRNVSKTVGNSYVRMVQHTPVAFGAVYDLGMAVSRHVKRSPVYYANAAMAKHLREYLQANPVDVILATHLFAAETLTWMKRHGDPLPPTIAVATDYTCIPFWEETDCDAFISPHAELVAKYVARGIPAEKLYALGIPVSPSFLTPMAKAEARAALGLAADKPYYLLVGGSMGAGDLGRLTSNLVKLTQSSTAELIVVCGSNAQMQRKLTARFRRVARVQVQGRTEQMRCLMAACDILYIKPGGLTSTEAAAARIPLVHTEPIPGCETENRSFFTSHGMSVSGDTTLAQARAGVALMKDPAACQAMRDAQAHCLLSDSALRICALAEQLASQRSREAGEP